MIDLNKDDFHISSDQDEIRVDGLCRELLREFHRFLLERGIDPEEAGSLAHGADYFLRDFVVASRRSNLFDEEPGLVRRFAATWYIISTLEPTIGEIRGYLRGILELYRFLLDRGLISAAYCEEIEQECADTPYYEERIESFWKITGDGYPAWERECTLKG
jgi:hypothetical protein